ncbi:FliH/SctL family protein [Xanthomonas cucurbitae]|uniref:FliH/SctL family protein n=1 Tax=Xanthomonas cucurbitae TaxID=56453 RepID=UPI002368399F|nr:FliH/SctL family protein [Xanthomonas cucurbitae]
MAQSADNVQASPGNEQAAYEESRELARAMGYQEGLARAHEEAAALAQQELARAKAVLQAEARAATDAAERTRIQLETLLQALTGVIEEQACRSQDVAVEVSFQAVTQVIGRAYASTPLLAELCRQAVRTAGHQAVALRVSEQDVDLCVGIGDLPVRCDLTLSPGQCVLETRAGMIEFGLDVRLSALQAALLQGLSRQRAQTTP